MKRLTLSQKIQHFRRARKFAIRQSHKKNQRSIYRKALPRTRVRWSNKFGSGEVFARQRIPMPENFCLEENYEETAIILARIRRDLSNGLLKAYRGHSIPERPGRLNSYFDFSTMQRCSPAAALIMASEYDRSRSLVDWSIPIIDHDRWAPAVVATLNEIGFFDLLDIQVKAPKKAETDSQVIQFMAGDTVSGNDASKLATTIAVMVFADVPDDADDAAVEARHKVYGPLVEAIENTILHAYLPGPDRLAVRRWWMTGAVNKNERHVNIVVYDQGQSIPATLPSWSEWTWIKQRLARFHRRRGDSEEAQAIDDAAKIRLAMDVPRSSTGHSNRGKGFPAFKEVLAGCRKGNLRIVSRQGEFLMEAGKKPVSRALNTPLTGTLVEWDLWL
jgi:hypothetical protein